MGQQCQNPYLLTQGYNLQEIQKVQIQNPKSLSQFGLPQIQQLSKTITELRQKNKGQINYLSNRSNLESEQEYVGYLQNNETREGYGELKTQQGKMYFGYFKDNLPHIKGVLVFNHQHYYIGQFLDGKMHGLGKQVSPYFQFVGEYKNDAKVFGKLSTQQFYYKGKLKNNTFQGYGQLRFTNRQKYIGFFQNGQFNGEGIYYSQQQRVIYEGQFKNNLYHGKGKYYWEDGSYYEGQYFEGLKHGPGNFYQEGQQTVSGIWFKGQITQRLKNDNSKASTVITYNNSNFSNKIEQIY